MAQSVASAVKQVFREQRQAYRRRNQERFGNFDRQLARALESSLLNLYMAAAQGKEAKESHREDFVALAKARAEAVASEINDTTEKWLVEGEDEERIWGDARVQLIEDTESRFATSASMTTVLGVTGKKMRWRNGEESCPTCKKLDGVVRLAGKAFGTFGGERIYHPPLHPFCKCWLEAV